MSRTAPLTSKRCILYIYSTNVGTEYFKHALYSTFFFSSKCSLFHNANWFGSCIIHILYTGCAETKKKNNADAKGLIHISLLFALSLVYCDQSSACVSHHPCANHNALREVTRRTACLVIARCPGSNKSSLEIVKTGSLQYIRTLIQLEISIIYIPSLSRTTRTHTHERSRTHTHISLLI